MVVISLLMEVYRSTVARLDASTGNRSYKLVRNLGEMAYGML